MLIHFEVIPVLVFDGAALPMKANTHKERRQKRKEALERALSEQQKGNMKAAHEWFQRACTATSDMARELIKQCRKINVEYVVAPYEADAQLAWMAVNGLIDCVLTEDSDLVVYGASKILYKMSKTGDGDLFQSRNIASLDDPPMYHITPDMFMWMCVCSGCDFFDGVKGLGIRRAHTLVKKHRTLSRLLHAIRTDHRYRVPPAFIRDFYRACLVFRHQTVFDTRDGKAVHLSSVDDAQIAMLPSGIIESVADGSHDLSFLGTQNSDDVMKRVAQGLLHPSSLKEYDDPLDEVVRPLHGSNFGHPGPPTSKAYQSGRRVNGALANTNNRAGNFRGFQVQPASGSASSAFRLSANLKKRLTPAPRALDPKLAAAQLITAQKELGTKRPASLTSSKGVWSKFKRPRTTGSVFRVQIKRRGEPQEDVQDRRKGVESEPSAHVEEHAVRVPIIPCSEIGSEETLPVPSSNLLDEEAAGLENVLGGLSDDEIAERAPSPDHDAYAMFDQMENEVSRGSEATLAGDENSRTPDNAERPSEKCSLTRARDGTGQPYVLRSRFFSSTSKRLSLPTSSEPDNEHRRTLISSIAQTNKSTTHLFEVFRRKARGRPVVNGSYADDVNTTTAHAMPLHRKH